ncbi:Alpha/beta hydrolase family protein [Streptomyces zhaozhouensis]|uniref:Alpha/beta hydrolase family protein n=1 Tax=Streptomyces zhaozhouensis TaxID=1300267 RepID=A0A286DV89_9ACTN|nr:alpha/beta fold hydrolase [Streptomyces zhaozhouensis]SOD62484.1 Alpha/beta hydrolase family protein [Streptomyces zhaozhouensis]
MTNGAPETGTDAVEMAALLAPFEPVAPEATLRYGDHPAQLVDLHGSGDPAVVVLHGGFWREAFDRSHLTPFARALAARGVAVAVPEFRRVGGGGGWPATGRDVRAALDALPGERPVVLAGHSAGGQLALVAADHPRVGEVFGVAAVSDLARAVELDLGRGATLAYLEDAEGGPEAALEAADPFRRPSPPVPVTLVHGAEDGQVPAELSRRFAERHGAGLALLPGVGHYAPMVPVLAAGAWLVDRLAEAAARR